VLRPVLPTWQQPLPRSPAGGSTLADVQRDYIARVLRDTSGVIGGPHGAAARLGLKRTTLLSRMERLGIARQAR
jgi:formate hydrogenlyase transcriptional activator